MEPRPSDIRGEFRNANLRLNDFTRSPCREHILDLDGTCQDMRRWCVRRGRYHTYHFDSRRHSQTERKSAGLCDHRQWYGTGRNRLQQHHGNALRLNLQFDDRRKCKGWPCHNLCFEACGSCRNGYHARLCPPEYIVQCLHSWKIICI